MDDFSEINPSFPAQAAGNASLTCGVEYQATTGEMIVAYSAILIMCLMPIISGSFASARILEDLKDKQNRPRAPPANEGKILPVIFCIMFGRYMLYRVLDTTPLSLLYSISRLPGGMLFFCSMLRPIRSLLGAVEDRPPQIFHSLQLRGDDYGYPSLVVAAMLGVWYHLKEHWMIKNLFGLILAHESFSRLHLESVSAGCIILTLYMVYDAIQLATNPALTRSSGAADPYKLVFAKDFLTNGLWGEHFAVIRWTPAQNPGIFIALLLRYDLSKGTGSKQYFFLSLVGYLLGIILTLPEDHNRAAALYTNALCVGIPLSAAYLNGEIRSLFSYRDEPDEVEE